MLPSDVRDVLREQSGSLERLFAQYCEGPPSRPVLQRHISQDQFLKFARDYKMCPGLMARVEILQLFRAMKSGETKQLWNRSSTETWLRYTDFASCLAACAAVVFSGDDWDAKYETLAQKLQLLLFWLDQRTTPRKTPLLASRSDKRPRALMLQTAARRGVVAAAERNGVVVEKALPPEVTAPSGHPDVQRKLQQLFSYYCTYGERLNVGPDAALNRTQVMRLLADGGCLDSPRSRQRVDVALAAFGVKRRRLDLEDLVKLLVALDDGARSPGEALVALLARHAFFAEQPPPSGEEARPNTTQAPSPPLVDDLGLSADAAAVNPPQDLRHLGQLEPRDDDDDDDELATTAPVSCETERLVTALSEAMTAVTERQAALSHAVDGGGVTASLEELLTPAEKEEEEDAELLLDAPPRIASSARTSLAGIKAKQQSAREECRDAATTTEREESAAAPGVSTLVDTISRTLGSMCVAGVALAQEQPQQKASEDGNKARLCDLRHRLQNRGEDEHYSRMAAAAAQRASPANAVGSRELHQFSARVNDDLTPTNAGKFSTPPPPLPSWEERPYSSRTSLQTVRAKLRESVAGQLTRLQRLHETRERAMVDRLAIADRFGEADRLGMAGDLCDAMETPVRLTGGGCLQEGGDQQAWHRFEEADDDLPGDELDLAQRRQQLCMLEAALVDQSRRLATLQDRLFKRQCGGATPTLRREEARASAMARVAATETEAPRAASGHHRSSERRQETQHQETRQRETYQHQAKSKEEARVVSCPAPEDILDLQPVEKPVDRSTWRNVAASRPTSARRGWVIADPRKSSARARDRSAEFWGAQYLENQRALGSSQVPSLPMQSSPAFSRNREPILGALKETGISSCKLVLELGCGPGEHAPYFVVKLGDASPTWQPTDVRPDACSSSDAHARRLGCLGTKIREAKLVDIAADEWAVDPGAFDAALAINVLHIAPHSAIRSFFRGVSGALVPGGLCGIYDTWTFDGKFVGPSNSRFDATLRAQGYSGIPTIEECDNAAGECNLHRRDVLYLPSNNQFVVYVKASAA
ncbi:hypothetical protein CTAYLR_006787 [Chrysophaeum taylorii]|uniref:Methyltransferase domain-containing protein n=1 Tax=Chrysophaeum taylorii TaxID=2483200 RepID=A0AAD7U8G0_9STRA|nr:hypothetical protein CTAYLR_006787 [Chrysophaeum taylorii]